MIAELAAIPEQIRKTEEQAVASRSRITASLPAATKEIAEIEQKRGTFAAAPSPQWLPPELEQRLRQLRATQQQLEA
jgi:hypothetical protein